MSKTVIKRDENKSLSLLEFLLLYTFTDSRVVGFMSTLTFRRDNDDISADRKLSTEFSYQKTMKTFETSKSMKHSKLESTLISEIFYSSLSLHSTKCLIISDEIDNMKYFQSIEWIKLMFQ